MKESFEEYLVQGEPTRKQRAQHWQIAIGLQDVDQLKNSPYLIDTAKQHIEGSLDLATAQKRIEAYYQTEEGRKLAADRTDEADLVATRIMAILAEDVFSFIPQEYAQLHKRLFEGIFPHAGQYRTVNISKKEWVLDGESVIYAPADLLKETIEYDFSQERQFSYRNLSPQETVKHICKFVSGLWQIHPFREGNTRTIAVFTILYLRKFGFCVSNEPFQHHSWFFRNALVRANYNNYAQGISASTIYLERFFENLIFQGNNELKNRFCHILWQNTPPLGGVNGGVNDILCYIKENPGCRTNQITVALKIPLRTLQRHLAALKKQGLIEFRGAPRNGGYFRS